MNWKETDKLRADQAANPLRWVAPLDGFVAPVFTMPMLQQIFKDGGSKSRRLRSWGKVTQFSPHFLATRSGTNMHTDPKYPRFSWHLILYNGGFRIRGVSDTEQPVLNPGVMYLLDTHSPHEVIRDERLPQESNYKVQIAIDSHEPTPREVAIEQIMEYIAGRDIYEMMLED